MNSLRSDDDGNTRDRPLRVFFLEDNADDVELELYELRKAGFIVESEVARNRSGFLEKIGPFRPDIILADYSLPDITGIEAISLCSDMHLSVPVILITGEGNEQVAVDSLRQGAIDYIIKKNISGLPARISRALEIWADRKAKMRAEAEEKRLHYMLFETQKMESIGRLAGGIAHDFNNLLTGVIGYAELCMKDVPADSITSERLTSIVAVSKRGADLVKQLLIFSKKVPLEFATVDINTFVSDTVRFLRRMVEETVEIRLRLGQEPLLVRCDTGHFTRVLMNLALNGRDAMQGRGVLTVGAERRQPGQRRPAPDSLAGDYVCIFVADTGCGITAEHQENIFAPFFTTKEPGKGTGLGLAIVESVVQSHGGVIEVDSTEGAGTTFRVYLPTVRSEEGPKMAQAVAATPSAMPAPGRGKVLVVEDEEMLRDVMTAMVRSLGYHVAAAKNGKEALELYRTGARTDLIISDMMMPVMGGLDLFRNVREIDPEARFILVTGYSLAGQDRELISKMNAVLMKPYTSDIVSAYIRAVLAV